MILSYTLPGAKEKILTKMKIHSIRRDPNNRWKKGMQIHHATGVRSKNYKCFLKTECEAVQNILMVVDAKDKLHITVERERLNNFQKQTLAENDGFSLLEELKDWFFPRGKNGKRKVSMFAGKIIYWERPVIGR